MNVAARTDAFRKILRQSVPKTSLMAVLFASSMVCSGLSETAFAQSFRFSNVRIEGNQRVDATTILSYAALGKGQALTAGQLNDAYQRIAKSGLFEEVELVPSGGTLIIKVREYPTINIINFEGNKRIKDETLAPVIKSQSRRVYSPAQAEADAAAITELYRTQGRIAATVTPKIIRRSENRVDLAFEIKEGRVVEIERLSFVGNRAFTDRRLRQVLATKQAGLFRRIISSDTFVADRIEYDKILLNDFYQARGYIDFQVLDAVGEVTRERDGFFVTFTVREGQSFRIGKVSMVSEVEGVDAAEFQKLLKLRSGITYSPTVIDNNIARLENLAIRKGLNFIRVEPRMTRNPRDLTLDVEFVIMRGPRIFVERIDIEGNTTTLDEVIRRQFRTAEGDPFNPREVRRAAERIRALGFFENAEVNTDQGSAPDQVVVNVDVVEQPTGSLSFGASYGRDAGIGLIVGFRESNFLGRGQSLSFDIGGSSDSTDYSFGFVEPAFLDRDLSFSVGAEYTKTNFQNADYDTRRVSIYTGIGFPISENGRLQLTYRYTDSRIKNVSDESSYVLHREEDKGKQSASSLGYSYTYDTRNTGLNPLGGVLLRFSQDFVGVGGDLRYLNTNALAMAERKVWNDDVTVRALFEGGMINMWRGDSRVTERYFGGSKIRGFESNGLGPRDLNVHNKDALGGNMFAMARLEAEFPVGLPDEYNIRGGLFWDVGSVWKLDNRDGGLDGNSPIDDDFHLRSSVGVSVFWDTIIGPLRFNFSKAIKKKHYDKERQFDVTISTQF